MNLLSPWQSATNLPLPSNMTYMNDAMVNITSTVAPGQHIAPVSMPHIEKAPPLPPSLFAQSGLPPMARWLAEHGHHGTETLSRPRTYVPRTRMVGMGSSSASSLLGQSSMTLRAAPAGIALLVACTLVVIARGRRAPWDESDETERGGMGSTRPKTKRSRLGSLLLWLPPVVLAMLPWRCAHWIWRLLRRRPAEARERARVESRQDLVELASLPVSLPPSLPSLIGSTSDPPSVLSPAQLEALRSALPSRLAVRDWLLAYSTEQHGCSIRTFYNRVERKGPTTLLVLDGQGHIFGAFVSESWRMGQHYFGNGETFLFEVHPHFRIFRWTRSNTHFVFAAADCIAFGGGSPGSSADSHFGLFLDSSFEFGTSHTSATYANEPLGGSLEFKCIKLEVWAFA